MANLSILLVLALSVIFAQTISIGAEMNSNVENMNIEAEVNNEPRNPTLPCLLYGDFGCNTKCSIAGSAFTLQGAGKCTDENLCHCTLQRDKSLEGLLKEKFRNTNGVAVLIQDDKEMAAKVEKILQYPYQTGEQAKQKLKNIVNSRIYYQLHPKQMPASDLKFFNLMNEPDDRKIKAYVIEKLNPVLESSNDKLKDTDYKSKLTNALESNANKDETEQSIMTEVRHTNNQSLADVLNEFLKSNRNIKEKPGDEDDIVEIIGLNVADKFVNRTNELKTSAAQ